MNFHNYYMTFFFSFFAISNLASTTVDKTTQAVQSRPKISAATVAQLAHLFAIMAQQQKKSSTDTDMKGIYKSEIPKCTIIQTVDEQADTISIKTNFEYGIYAWSAPQPLLATIHEFMKHNGWVTFAYKMQADTFNRCERNGRFPFTTTCTIEKKCPKNYLKNCIRDGK